MQLPLAAILLLLPFLALGQQQEQNGVEPEQPACPLIGFNHRAFLSEMDPQVERRLFKVGFEPEDENLNLEWVDVHFNFGGEVMNHRLLACPEDNSDCEGFSFVSEVELDLSVLGGKLSYFFTYSLGGLACDSEVFENANTLPVLFDQAVSEQQMTTLPVLNEERPNCPLFNFSHEVIFNEEETLLTSLRFLPLAGTLDFSDMDFVDLHFEIDSGEVINVRLDLSSSVFQWLGEISDTRLAFGPGSVLKYFFTYSWRGVACDSEIFTHSNSHNLPIMQQDQQNSEGSRQLLGFGHGWGGYGAVGRPAAIVVTRPIVAAPIYGGYRAPVYGGYGGYYSRPIFGYGGYRRPIYGGYRRPIYGGWRRPIYGRRGGWGRRPIYGRGMRGFGYRRRW